MKFFSQNIGWKSKVTLKRATFSISINKLVAVGSSLQKGQTLYCYLAADEQQRPLMVVYLDGKEKMQEDAPAKTDVLDI